MGVSIDSIHCHGNWAKDLGGVSFPLLSDFHPKGAMASAYGTYLENNGITDRATVLVDAGGMVRHASSVTPSGERKIDDLVALCAKLDAEYDGPKRPFPAPPALRKDVRIFVKNSCGFSRSVLLAIANLHLESLCPVANVTESAAAMAELKKLTGKEQAPCLLVGQKPMLESKEIIRYLVDSVAPLPG